MLVSLLFALSFECVDKVPTFCDEKKFDLSARDFSRKCEVYARFQESCKRSCRLCYKPPAPPPHSSPPETLVQATARRERSHTRTPNRAEGTAAGAEKAEEGESVSQLMAAIKELIERVDRVAARQNEPSFSSRDDRSDQWLPAASST
ncbi:MAG: hypothetical protein SGPRY_014652 [Prymnesium sp.]